MKIKKFNENHTYNQQGYEYVVFIEEDFYGVEHIPHLFNDEDSARNFLLNYIHENIEIDEDDDINNKEILEEIYEFYEEDYIGNQRNADGVSKLDFFRVNLTKNVKLNDDVELLRNSKKFNL